MDTNNTKTQLTNLIATKTSELEVLNVALGILNATYQASFDALKVAQQEADAKTSEVAQLRIESANKDVMITSLNAQIVSLTPVVTPDVVQTVTPDVTPAPEVIAGN